MSVQAAIPSTAPSDLGSIARLALGAAATAIATNGAQYLQAHNLITSEQTADVVSWGSGLILGAAALVWAKLKNIHTENKLNAAAATGDPQAHVSAPETVAAIQAAIASPTSPITAK